jgi:transposase
VNSPAARARPWASRCEGQKSADPGGHQQEAPPLARARSPARRIRGGCLAHARRKVFEARKTAPEADTALAIITAIYKVEREAKAAAILGTPAHLTMRNERSRPLMEDLHSWLEEQKPHHVPKGPMRKAIRYALGNWHALTRFLDDPNIDPDNTSRRR